jgi:hypothetical protein
MTDHTITLTNAAAVLLGQICASTVPDKFREVVLVGEFSENYLSDLRAPVQPANDGKPADWVAWDKEVKAWQRETLPAITVTDAQRDALRGIIKKGKDKVAGTAGGAKLIVAFGLADD